ncbi:branched-chain-amino-acid transaminase [Geminicoccaceae bacterium 1502E]|nr:branched-chain-amino-acid transaminase [Geminicoccaceae bacterium 1502E]
MSTCAWMYHNGCIVPYEQAQVHAFSGAVKYGAGVFEGLRGYWNEESGELWIFRLREHLERLRFGMRALRLDTVFEMDELERAMIELARANELRENTHFRMIAYIEGDDELAGTGPVGLVAGAVKRPPSARIETGIHVGISSWQRIADNALPPRVKCTANYINNRAAELEARAAGYDGVLMLTADGKLSEGSGACLFLVRDGRLVTPDTGSDILESITRETIIALARDQLGLEVIERRVDRTELLLAEEAFLCGSGQEVLPVISVARQAVGAGAPGPLTRALQNAYFDLVCGRTAQHADWRTPVWGGR